MINLPMMLLWFMCYLTFLQFMDASLYGVLGMGALSLWAGSVVWNDIPRGKKTRRD